MRIFKKISATDGATVGANLRVCQNETAYRNRIRPSVVANLRVCPNVPQKTMGTMTTVLTHETAMSMTTPHNVGATLAVAQNGNKTDTKNGNKTIAKNLSERLVGTRHALSLLQKIAAMAIIVAATFFIGCNKPPDTTETCHHWGVTGKLEWCLNIETGTLTITGKGGIPNFGSGRDPAPWYSYKDEITNVVLGSGVTTIGKSAFYGYTSLVSVDMPNVTTIEDYVFGSCTSLVSVDMPNVATIGTHAFTNCTSLVSVEMPNVATIGQQAFTITSLASINLSSVKIIECFAFWRCHSLTSVTIPSSVTRIGHSYTGSTEECAPFPDCQNLTSINVDSTNEFYTSVNGILFNKSITRLINYPAGKQETSYTTPHSVSDISESAFRDCKNLVSVTLSNSLSNVGRRAFANCISLEHIYSPRATPPVCSDNDVFNEVPVHTCILYVPVGSVDAYRTAWGWALFTNIVEL